MPYKVETVGGKQCGTIRTYSRRTVDRSPSWNATSLFIGGAQISSDVRSRQMRRAEAKAGSLEGDLAAPWMHVAGAGWVAISAEPPDGKPLLRSKTGTLQSSPVQPPEQVQPQLPVAVTGSVQKPCSGHVTKNRGGAEEKRVR